MMTCTWANRWHWAKSRTVADPGWLHWPGGLGTASGHHSGGDLSIHHDKPRLPCLCRLYHSRGQNGLLQGATVLAMGGRSTAIIVRAGSKPKTTIIKEILGFERVLLISKETPGNPDGE